MEILYSIFVAPFLEMGAYPDLFIQARWDVSLLELYMA